jgi:hypothetical protein
MKECFVEIEIKLKKKNLQAPKHKKILLKFKKGVQFNQTIFEALYK